MVDADVYSDPETETWTAECTRLGCGGFITRNHPTKKSAQERMKQHHDEHDEGLERELQAMTEKG